MSKFYSYKNIWHIAGPIILGSLAQDIITIADTIFIGRIGEISIGAIAIAGIFYLAIVMLAFGFGIGIQVLIARRYGEKKYEELTKIVFHSLLLLLFFAVIIFAVLQVFTPFILSQIVENRLIRQGALDFLTIRYFGLFAAFLNVGFRSLFIGISKTKIISHTTVIMSIANILFDYLLIFGVGTSLTPMGLKGAALASVIAEYIALIIFMKTTFTKKSLSNFRFSIKQRVNFTLIKQILKIATPTMAQNFISFVAWFVFFIFVEKMGSQQLAVSNIIRSIYIILLLPITGFAAATNSLISYSIGIKQNDKIFLIIKKSILLSWVFIGAITLISLLFPTQIISVFTSDYNLQSATLPVFYIISGASFFLAFGIILFNAVTGTGNTFSAMIIEISVIALYLYGVNLMARLNISITYVWIMEFFYGLGLGVVSLFWLKLAKWQNKKV